METLTPEVWLPRAQAHAERARRATAEHLQRRRSGHQHPVWDFLFDYYGFPPAQLARWHPGPGVALVAAPQHAGWRYYRAEGERVWFDAAAFVAARGEGLSFAIDVLAATDARPARFDCFGLHEWAMVYRTAPEQVRHTSLPLRLGHAGTDAVVEAHELRCSQYDAFRFFTPAAAGRNQLLPVRAAVVEHEQPGCLHGGAMDLYRWAFKMTPAVPSELVLDCFALARDARLLDMRSSPYDVSSLGWTNIAVETPEGKAEHVTAQREIAERARPLRAELLTALRRVLAAA